MFFEKTCFMGGKLFAVESAGSFRPIRRGERMDEEKKQKISIWWAVILPFVLGMVAIVISLKVPEMHIIPHGHFLAVVLGFLSGGFSNEPVQKWSWKASAIGAYLAFFGSLVAVLMWMEFFWS